ncbi:hypothetical protein SAY86_018911 [Trapa natans]|uniref:F-box domain-containing protein n=1 Tax=Trapa natans TaxID=22666 RepID=A0AAN7LB47_TRANT|nr:hypothetical protein SAY86_018911 [Trapa natans]
MDSVSEPPVKRGRSRAGGDVASGMERLPREIALDILSRLPVTSIVYFGLVSKSWRELARDPLLPELQLVRSARSEPFLVFHCDLPVQNHLYFVELSAHQGGTVGVSMKKLCPPPWADMAEFEVVGSFNGILCLADSLFNESVCLYNPFTKDCHLLPRTKPYPNQEVAFGFGVDPKTGRFKVVRVVYYTKAVTGTSRARRTAYQLSEVQVLTVGGGGGGGDGDGEWRSLGKAPYQITRRPSEAVLHGRLHWVARPRRSLPIRPLVSFDLSEERFDEVPIPDSGPLNWCNYQVTVLGGSLAAIANCYHGKIEIWAMKVYGERDSWGKKFSIGSHVPRALRRKSPSLPPRIFRRANAKVRALCFLEGTGEVLLEYKSRALVAYDPKKDMFRDIHIKGTPTWFQSFTHLGTLGRTTDLPLRD